jgi:hypothetical protein
MKNLPTICPSCQSQLTVARLVCPECGTGVEGSFRLPLLAGLPPDDHRFILDFVKSSGSLKEMARLLGVSYPTVRNRLDEIIARVRAAEEEESA